MAEGTNNVQGTVEAVKGIVEAVPIYEDAIQPAAKEVGKGLTVLAKTINVALSPLSAMVWGYEKIQNYITTSLEQKLEGVPAEDIVSPTPHVAGPALEALKYTGHEVSLREMYSNLLATSMQKDFAHEAHPAFVEIIRQLTSDEAKILYLLKKDNYRALPMMSGRVNLINKKEYVDVFTNMSLVGVEAGCDRPTSITSYLDNLKRLGLVNLDKNISLTKEGIYDGIRNNREVLEFLKKAEEDPEVNPQLIEGSITITNLGKQFCNACISISD